ncbi:MAG: beta-ketoacyl synthase N-terminal-like domain-containing protein [Polyangiaceae bacterium]
MTLASVGHTGAPIVMSGVGLITPLGDTLAAVGEALHAGRRAVAAAVDLGGAGEARIGDFDAARYATIRGMRMYNRTTRLGICAAKLALVDAAIEPVSCPAEQLGVLTASTFGHLDTLIEYDRSLVTAGLQRTNPALMPLAIPSAPGAMIALSFGAKAFSMTVSQGAASSLDAIGLAWRLLESGRARACVVVGAFAICTELSLAASRAGMFAAAEAFRVFDRRSCGTAFGEGAAAVVLERLDDCRSRGAAPKATLRGYGSAFAPRPRMVSAALERAGRTALGSAQLASADIRLVSSGASGLPDGDRAEATALVNLLGETAHRTPIVAPKASLGESVDAGGLIQALAALFALRTGVVPPIPELDEPDVPGLRYARTGMSIDDGHALVTSTSSTGACSALVLAASHAA